MQALVVSWQVYQMTKDPLALGMIGLVRARWCLSVLRQGLDISRTGTKNGILFCDPGTPLGLHRLLSSGFPGVRLVGDLVLRGGGFNRVGQELYVARLIRLFGANRPPGDL